MKEGKDNENKRKRGEILHCLFISLILHEESSQTYFPAAPEQKKSNTRQKPMNPSPAYTDNKEWNGKSKSSQREDGRDRMMKNQKETCSNKINSDFIAHHVQLFLKVHNATIDDDDDRHSFLQHSEEAEDNQRKDMRMNKKMKKKKGEKRAKMMEKRRRKKEQKKTTRMMKVKKKTRNGKKENREEEQDKLDEDE